MNINTSEFKFLRFLVIVLLLSVTIAAAVETTWRHSGFEISGFDINGSSIYNLTEIRKIEFGWNSAVPAVSETSRAVMYYDDNQKRIMQSVNGGEFQTIVDNSTVNSSNRINGGFSTYFPSVAVSDLYELPFYFYNGTITGVKIRASDGVGNVTLSVGNRSNDITGGNNLILNNAQEQTINVSVWNTTVNINEVFRLQVLSLNGSIGNLSMSFVIVRD